jgi:energy-converting hydrogenase Eha subunit A
VNRSGLAGVGGDSGTVAPSPDARHRAEPGRPQAVRWTWPAAYAVAAIVLFLCYLRLSGTQTVTSDGASIALNAWDMLHGNWLLSGWSLVDVTYYTTEIPEYILVEIFRGLGPADVHVSAAITYTLLVVLAGLLAKGGKTGKEGIVRVLIAAGIMIAPQVGPGAFLLLLSPDHTGTGVPLLLIFLVLDRAPRRWWLPPLIGLLLVWAEVGDPIVLTLAAGPIAVICAVRAYRDIVQRRRPARESWFELALAACAVVSAGVAQAVVKIIGDLGGFHGVPVNTTFAQSAAWPAHIALAMEGVLGLYGADVTGRTLQFSTAIALIHLAGLALAVWAVGRAIRRFFACDDLITQVLTVAILVNLAAYVFSLLPNTFWDNREIANVLPFGAVLAGRLLADKFIQARLLPALTAVGCCYLVALGYGVTRAQAPAHDQALTDWLSAHHLSDGLGSYAEGNSVRLDSHGTIRLLAPGWRAHSVWPGTHLAKASDFDPGHHYVNFVVTTTQDGPAFYIPPAWIINTFGQPAHTYHYGVWTIMTWNKNLLNEIS